MSDTFEFSIPEQNQGGNPPPCASDASAPQSSKSDAGASNGAASRGERRCRRRALISAPVRVRGLDVTEGGPDEISTTLDVSRGGLLFATKSAQFEAGMVR